VKLERVEKLMERLAEPGQFRNATEAARNYYDFMPIQSDTPTDTPAGSAARVEVYAQRYQNGEAIYHPDDSKIGYAPRYDTRKVEFISRLLGDRLIRLKDI
jgi:hypothetical protein